LDDLESHLQPVQSAILATAGFLVYFATRSLTVSADGRETLPRIRDRKYVQFYNQDFCISQSSVATVLK